MHAVAPLVAAIAKAALVLFVLRRRGFEVGAGQIIEQDVEADTEPGLHSLPQRRLGDVMPLGGTG